MRRVSVPDVLVFGATICFGKTEAVSKQGVICETV